MNIKQMIKKNKILIKVLKKIFNILYFCKSKYFGFLYGREIIPLLEEETYNEKKNVLEQKKGNNSSENTYFVICRSYKGIGMYTHVCVYLSFIAYAINKGYIPVIDMCNYPNIYMKDENIGKCNAWELYFEQPMGISLNDIVASSEKVIYSSSVHLPNRTPFITSLLNDKKEFELYARIYRDFIKYNKYVGKYTDDELKIIENKKVLGVLFRGTDYVNGKPKGHPVQPTIKQAIIKAGEIMRNFKCEYIYLASDEKKAQIEFEKAFPEKVLINKRKYYDLEDIDYSKHFISEVSFSRDNDEFLKGLEYISSINILSKCSCFLGGCAGTYAAVIINNNEFEHMHVFDLGLYK